MLCMYGMRVLHVYVWMLCYVRLLCFGRILFLDSQYPDFIKSNDSAILYCRGLSNDFDYCVNRFDRSWKLNYDYLNKDKLENKKYGYIYKYIRLHIYFNDTCHVWIIENIVRFMLTNMFECNYLTREVNW